MKFYTGKSKTNYHGTEKLGEKWNKETVRGPKFKLVHLGYAPNKSGWRLIFYFPSGAWWYGDVYPTKKTTTKRGL